MATQQPAFSIGTLTAAADLSAKQFHAVKITAAQQVNLSTVAGEPVIGILQNKPASGAAADIMVIGVTKVKAGAAIAAGASVMAGADGRIITAATAGSEVIGKALEAAANADEIISILLVAHQGIV